MDYLSRIHESMIACIHLFNSVYDRSKVQGAMIYLLLICVPARVQDDSELKQHNLTPNKVVSVYNSIEIIGMCNNEYVEVWRLQLGSLNCHEQD